MSKDPLSKIKNSAVSKWAGITGRIPTPTAAEPTVSPDLWDSVFPMVKQVFAKTAGLELVSVAPMSAPSGTLFYSDMTYKEDSPLDVLKRVIPKWRANKADQNLENKVREYIDKSVPGLSNQRIDSLIDNDKELDDFVWMQSVSGKFGL